MGHILFRLSPPPLFFLLLIVAAVFLFLHLRCEPLGGREPNPRPFPHHLARCAILLLLLLIRILRTEHCKLGDIGWRIAPGQTLTTETLLVIGLGAALAVFYLTALSPLIELAQTRIGDYVPPGEIMPALGGMIVPFFIANLVLAPFVDESLYRG